MQEIGGDMLRGHLETMILSVLDHGEAHGLEIIRRLEERSAGSLQIKEGSLYPALYRLVNGGLLEARWEQGQAGRRGARRRYYTLTDRGARELARRRQEWRRFVSTVGSVLGEAT